MWMDDLDLVPKRSGLTPASQRRSQAPAHPRPGSERRTASPAAPDLAAVVSLILVPTVILLLLVVALA